MNRTHTRLMILFSLFLNFNCTAQSHKPVGGACEGCEAIYEYGEKTLINTDTLPDFRHTEPKLKLTGIVFQSDGNTPASDVILYVYHTDQTGVYPKKGDETDWARRHGYLRGWIKTDQSGRYTFYTFRPSAYPDGSEPEHIHLTVKEPEKSEYYLDDFLFEDDPILTQDKRRALANRGGSGIGLPQIKSGILTFHRDIILGLNIPDYD